MWSTIISGLVKGVAGGLQSENFGDGFMKGLPLVGDILKASDKGIQNQAMREQYRKQQRKELQSTNPFGEASEAFKMGGMIKKKLHKYYAPKHENGGMMLDNSLQPTNNPNDAIAEIEKEETIYDDYVFSDTLKHQSGKTFADVSKYIDKKYKNKNSDLDNKARNMELKLLSLENEQAKDLDTYKNGGNIPKYPDGGDLLFDEPLGDEPYLGSHLLENKQGNEWIALDKPVLYQIMDNEAKTKTYTQPEGYNLPMDLTKPTSTIPKSETTSEETTTDKKGFNYILPSIIGKGTELLGKAAILGKGYDRVTPRLNEEAMRIKNLMAKRGIDYTALVNRINLSKNAQMQSNQNARSLNVKRALDNATYANAQQQKMNTKLQENQLNNQYRGEEAQMLDKLGMEKAQALHTADVEEAQNKGQYQTNVGTLLGDIGRAGAFETKRRVNDMQVKESLALLGEKYADFGVDEETYKRLMNGTYTNSDLKVLNKSVIKHKGNE